MATSSVADQKGHEEGEDQSVLMEGKVMSVADTNEIQVALDRGEHVQTTLEVVPSEVLLEVLSFVLDKWLLNCALVCREWRDVVASQTFWRKKCLRTRRFIEKYMAPYYPKDWREFYFKSPYTRNLIKNPSGKDGREAGWTITSDGGDGWLVETTDGGSDPKPDELRAISDGSPHQFATSFGWCKRFQGIDLVAEGISAAFLDEVRPDIYVSEWYAPRFDCGSVYKLKVKLMKERNDEKPEDVIDEFTFELTTPQWAPHDWKQVSHVFTGYGPGLRFIQYKDSSKDTQFWKGHYGSKMAGSVVRVQLE
ncbi:F-box only protein 6-like isoform X1 [Patiria miniata]|uniref:F-box protein n=1 Tax=Patiria miniata TaxID=46514 RepID=A0A914BHI5_PATMI|nr:F-box only protein 6-like isoform X1 [Patiria miniata]